MRVLPYVGLPFLDKGRGELGVDCWGLVWRVYREQFEIELPSYIEDYASSQEGSEVSALIQREAVGWPEVTREDAQLGDVVILRMNGRPWHCGLVLDPPWFLHADRECGVVRERWDALLWERRLLAVHRHPSMIGRTFR